MAIPIPDAPPYPYFDFLKKRVVEAARQANARLKPAQIGFGTGKAYINANRDEKIAGRYTQGFNPEEPSGKTVAVLTMSDTAGKPIAVYANYAVHGVVMFFSKSRDGKVEITGDIPGVTSRFVEEQLGNDVVALWTSGAAGDQNPVYTSMNITREGGFRDTGAGGWVLLDAQARRLAEEIVRVVGGTRDMAGDVDVKVRTTALVCPGQKVVTPGAPADPAMPSWAPAKIEWAPSGMAVGAHMKLGCADPGIPATFKQMGAALLVQPGAAK